MSRVGIALALAGGGWGATTVSATLVAAAGAGVRLMPTGGIGGVHPGAVEARDGSTPTLDISPDLDELARSPVAVACSGPKSILDVPLTLEYLETRGVPVVGYGTKRLPGFYSIDGGADAPFTVEGPTAAVAVAVLTPPLRVTQSCAGCRKPLPGTWRTLIRRPHG